MSILTQPGLEVIKLEFILKLKIKCNDWLLAESAMIGCLWTRVRKQPTIALYFESVTVLKLYNLEARLSENLNLLGDICFFWHYGNLLCFLRMPITLVTMRNCANLPTNVQWIKSSVSTYL